MIAQTLRRLLIPATVVVSVVALLAVVAPRAASALDFFPEGNPATDVCAQKPDAPACSGDGEDNITGTDGIILRAAGLVALLASVAAVIGMMIAGMMMISANGDSSKISNARQMIIYTAVGLVVVFVARTVVVFIVNNV